MTPYNRQVCEQGAEGGARIQSPNETRLIRHRGLFYKTPHLHGLEDTIPKHCSREEREKKKRRREWRKYFKVRNEILDNASTAGFTLQTIQI